MPCHRLGLAPLALVYLGHKGRCGQRGSVRPWVMGRGKQMEVLVEKHSQLCGVSVRLSQTVDNGREEDFHGPGTVLRRMAAFHTLQSKEETEGVTGNPLLIDEEAEKAKGGPLGLGE